ncbi:thymidylate synthase [Gammaproteobacteria bacterium]
MSNIFRIGNAINPSIRGSGSISNAINPSISGNISGSVTAIVCTDKNRGIGNDGGIPWLISEDFKFFKKTTIGSIVVMGRKTWESLPGPLTGRLNYVLTNSTENKDKGNGNQHVIFGSIKKLQSCIETHPHFKNVFIIGGESVYKQFFDMNIINEVIMTVLPKAYKCDVFMPYIPYNYELTDYKFIDGGDLTGGNYKRLWYKKNDNIILKDTPDYKYFNLCKQVIDSCGGSGSVNAKQELVIRKDRTNTGTYSMFGGELKFDISKYLPIYTTKRIAWKACIEELLWFLRGDTDVKKLQAKGVKIWDGNSTRKFLGDRGLVDYPEYIIGEGYGYQWRNFGGTDYNPQDPDNYVRGGTGFDQVTEVIRLLKKDPYSRRILINAWNPQRAHRMSLVPCHYSVQFYVKECTPKNKLSIKVVMRSNDLFLGNPFNVTSYAILAYIIAMKVDMVPDELILSIGDSHIYSNHLEQMYTQMDRIPSSSPLMVINEDVRDKKWEDISIDDFEMIGYQPYPSIKAYMAV